MRRALYLATLGEGRVSPNPMVGAVIYADGRIIGEGYHRKYGGPHAEPNAVNSVREADRPLLREATMFVTLEPCAHFGKTPPCAQLIVDSGIPKVIVATGDPFSKVCGKGIEMMRQAGVEVRMGLLGEESRRLNRHFFTSHTLGRPYILLKWAQTTDGYMGTEDGRLLISNPLSEVWMHRERAKMDAIMVGVNTVIKENPSLTCRLWPTRDPETRPARVSFESPRLPSDSTLACSEPILKHREESLDDFMKRLYKDHGITSLMVEGGPTTLSSFLGEGLFDEIRMEVSPDRLGFGVKAPDLSSLLSQGDLRPVEDTPCRHNRIHRFLGGGWEGF